MSNQQELSAVRATTDAWTQAVRDKNADKVATFFAKDVVSFDLAPPLKTTGFERDPLAKWFSSWDGPIGYEVTDQHITVSDTLTVIRSLNHLTGKKVDGEQVDLWVRATACLQKEGDQWKVIHVHTSVPLMMDGSNKAAVDLKP
jgi:PhnB protein